MDKDKHVDMDREEDLQQDLDVEFLGTSRGRGLRGRGRGRPVKRRIWGAVEEKRTLEESIQLVEKVIGKKMRELTECQKEHAKMNNPPTLIFTRFTQNQYVQGVWKENYTRTISSTPQYGLSKMGKTGFLNKLTNNWVEKEGKIHFHLHMECL